MCQWLSYLEGIMTALLHRLLAAPNYVFNQSVFIWLDWFLTGLCRPGYDQTRPNTMITCI